MDKDIKFVISTLLIICIVAAMVIFGIVKKDEITNFVNITIKNASIPDAGEE